ncbi:MAG: protein translocase subunit SecDF [Flavobacteriaceae bacterium]|jgi:SecD/SecF fusion protein|nr:protein translocase subunit SecDF [Flavobacteriaceae bacterium]
MQNNGLVKLFAVLFVLVSIYQLSFTFIVNQTEDKARLYAESQVDANTPNYFDALNSTERQYLDSVASDHHFGYTNAKARELNKGLDLKGGINVILQISVKDILKGLAENTRSPLFNQALVQADELQKSSDESYVESFFTAFESLKGDKKLASPSIFANRTLSDDIRIDMSDEEAKPIIRIKIDESIVSAFEVLRKRIDKFGVTQPNIQRLGNSGRILVELPGARDIERVKNLLQSTAQLEFWETESKDKLLNFLFQANETLKSIVVQKPTDEPKDDDSEIDDLLADIEAQQDSVSVVQNPIFDLIVDSDFPGPVLVRIAEKDQPIFDSYLRRSEVRSLLPAELRFTKFLWSKGDPNSELVDLYAIRANLSNTPPLGGSVIVDARSTYDQFNSPAVSMQMNAKGARIWEEMTGKAFRENGNIAIVLDNLVYSAPGVSKGAISGGRSEISGQFSVNEATDLANVLRAGKLPAAAEIIQSEIIGPSLGAEAIESGVNSFMIALILVLVWMMFYYGRAGFFADIALTLNIILIFGILAGLGAVLTLPGIAGIVLTIGMSVDANVLIFERIREELNREKGLKLSVSDGFQNALSSILDANITTGLTALILFLFGTGPIKGFATTLLIGIATSLFTAIFITRILVDSRVAKKKSLAFSTSITKNLFRNLTITFLTKRKFAYLISGVLIIVAVSSLFTNGLNQGVDFVGGRSYTVRFDQAINSAEVQSDLVTVLGNAEAKIFGNDNQLKITTNYKVDVEGAAVDDEIKQLMYSALQSYLPDGTDYISFATISEKKEIGIMSSIKVGPTIADDIKKNSFLAVFGSLIVVFLYILLRFRKWQFSLGAVAAVFHDVLVVLGVFSLTYTFMPFNMEINQAFIAAVLTVIGYSLNDTVVVFDRIREFARTHSSWPYAQIVNTALNSTLSRTLNTSLTTLVVLLAIFLFGGEAIRGFMFALIVGVIVGTYSSMFIATPIMFDTLSKKSLNEEEKE